MTFVNSHVIIQWDSYSRSRARPVANNYYSVIVFT